MLGGFLAVVRMPCIIAPDSSHWSHWPSARHKSMTARAYLRAKLLTDDEGVRQLARYFEPSALRSDRGGRETRLVANVQFLELLTDLAVDRERRSALSQHTDNHEPEEFDAMCTMILAGTESGA